MMVGDFIAEKQIRVGKGAIKHRKQAQRCEH